jgi:hypothetical protein
MGLTILRRGVVTREVLLAFGIAEAAALARMAQSQGAPVPSALQKAVAGAPLTTADEDHVVRIIGVVRGAMVGYFVHNPTTWLEATLAADDLASLRLNRWFLQDAKYGGARSIAELLDSPGGGDYRITGYDPAFERGHLLLVGTAEDLPSLRLAEGAHRSVERTARHRAGLQDPPVRVFVGVCPSAEQWVPYQDNAPAPNTPPGFTWWVP